MFLVKILEYVHICVYDGSCLILSTVIHTFAFSEEGRGGADCAITGVFGVIYRITRVIKITPPPPGPNFHPVFFPKRTGI